MLGGIVLTADLLTAGAKSAAPAAQIERYAHSIRRFSGRMERLISDLVDVSSMEAGNLSLIPEPVDPRTLVTESVEAFQIAATRHGIELSSEIGERVRPATLDRERILQVITNLVGNALKFTPRDGRITISVESLQSEVRFTVADTGCGIESRQPVLAPLLAPDLTTRLLRAPQPLANRVHGRSPARHILPVGHDRRRAPSLGPCRRILARDIDLFDLRGDVLARHRFA